VTHFLRNGMLLNATQEYTWGIYDIHVLSLSNFVPF